MPPELRPGSEELNINLADDLKSLSQQLSKMKKEVTKTVESMSKEIGTGLIDMNLVKRQFQYLNKYLNKQTEKFGKETLMGYKKRLNSFLHSQNEIIRQLQKNRVFTTLNEQQKQIVNVFKELNTQVGTLDFPDAFESSKETIKDIIDESDQLIQKAIKEGILQTSNVKRAREFLEIMKGEVYLKQQSLEKAVLNNAELTAMRDSISDIVDKSFELFDKIPGGEYFKTALGLDKIKEDIKGNIGNSLKDSFATGVSATQALKVAMGGVVSAYMQFAKMLLFNPWTIALVGVALLIKQFVDLEAAAEDFRKTTGLTLALTKELTPQIESTALSLRKYGVTIEGAYESAAALYTNFQNIQIVTPELIKTVALMNAKLGVSFEKSAEILEIFSGMKGASKENLKSWIDTTMHLSHAAGIAPVDVFNDIAESAEFVATYMGASADETIRAAVNARKFGLELSDVATIVETAMDFGSSIEKELEASILLGKQINFNAARQKIFDGDIEGATKEILSQVGTLEDFNKMNFIQKKAIAEATGLTVSQLQQSLTLQSKLSKMTAQERLQYDQQQKDLQQINSTVTDLKNSFMAIGAALGRVVLPIINLMRPAVKQIADLVAIISDGINYLVDGVDKLIPGSKEFTAQIAGWPLLFLVAKKPLSGLIGMFGKLFSFGGGKTVATTVEKTTGAIGGIGSKINPTSMIKAAASILIISGALWVFAKALQEIDKVKDITKTLIAATIGLTVLAVVALALGGASPAMLLGALTIAVLAGALWLLGAALNEFVPFVDVFLKGMGAIIEIIGDAVVKIIGAVTESFKQLAGLGPQLATSALGIYAVAGALAAFTAVSAASGFASMFSGLFGDSPIDQLERLAAIGPGLMITANALRQIGSITSPEILASGKFEDIDVLASTAGIGNVINESNEKVNKKLDEVIAAVKDINVYLDGRKVNENVARNTSSTKLT
ncbi:MAG: hypothetical protein JETCAE03_33190 [Ignavibacteriaceae bacterium]|jgi:hypothetical protein|nr:MAG: hypothetical protein JETCAE03_33190 [Ignavibacteriaceae bacterium]